MKSVLNWIYYHHKFYRIFIPVLSFSVLEIDFRDILIGKPAEWGPPASLLFSSCPGPHARVPPPVGAHAERSASQAATASSLPHPVRSHDHPYLFLTAPEPPLARVRPSTEASRPHGTASIAVEFQSAHHPHAGPSSNRAHDRRPDRACCPQSCCRASVASLSTSPSGACRAMLVGRHRITARLRLYRSCATPSGARALLPLTAGHRFSHAAPLLRQQVLPHRA
jgi:hypothetical protein